MEKKNDFIHVEKVQVNEKDAVSIEMYGDIPVLVSILFSSMKANQDLAQIVMHAAQAYIQSEARESKMN